MHGGSVRHVGAIRQFGKAVGANDRIDFPLELLLHFGVKHHSQEVARSGRSGLDGVMISTMYRVLLQDIYRVHAGREERSSRPLEVGDLLLSHGGVIRHVVASERRNGSAVILPQIS